MFWQKLKNKIHPKDVNSIHKRLAAINYKTMITHQENGSNSEHLQTKLCFMHSEHHLSSGHSKAVNFHDIVDEDDRCVEQRFTDVFVGWLIESLPFRMIMLVAILLNCLVIGIQTDKYLEENYNALFIALDKLFLTIFVLEILIKWYHDFFGFWRVNWNIFDFVIVAFSLLGPSLTFLSGSRWLTILRVLRALRSLRSISALRGLQIVVQTVMHSIPDMANIVALLLICMFIFGILGQSFFGDSCKQHFGSLGTTMFSLFVCVTQDGWMGITQELNECGYSILGAIYLLVFITIGAFIFANLVVAVVVTNLEWAIAEQKELENKNSKPTNEKSSKIVTLDANETLTKLAQQQEPIELPHRSNLNLKKLEDYFLVVSAQEDNLAEFKRLKEQITEIHHEIKALATLDDVSDDEVFELSAMAGGTSHVSSSISIPPPLDAPRRRFNSLSCGDAVSDLISMNRAYPIAPSRTRNLHQMISSLATASAHHSSPHSQSAAVLQPGEPSHVSVRAESAL